MKGKLSRKYAYPAVICILFLLIAAAFFRQYRENRQKPISRDGFLFDTSISVSLYGTREESILDGAFDLCRKYENEFSPTLETSALYRMNHRGSGVTEWEADADLAAITEKGIEYGEKTDGAFDVTILPVSSLWDFRSGEAKLPDPVALKNALGEVNFRNVRVEGTKIFFRDDKVQIDPGALAKGYIADRLKDYLLANGVRSALINLGGNVLCVGEKPDGEAFQVAIRKPEKDSTDVVKVLSIRDRSVVSSGIYERCFDLDGVHYHHILNPRDGMPYQNGLSSVTVVGPSSLECDALSTSCFSLGEEEGLRLLDSMDGYYGYFIRTDGTMISSKAAPDGGND